MKLRYSVALDVDPDYIHHPGEPLPPGDGLKRVAELAEACENAISDAVSWKHGVVHGTVKVEQLGEELPRLKSGELLKGTGDILKDLDHAERMTDTSEPGFGSVVCSGRELDFVNRALRVARAVVKQQQKKQQKVEAAFRGGYHCQWIESERRYIFDPLMKPGDPDGAFRAWQQHQGQPCG